MQSGSPVRETAAGKRKTACCPCWGGGAAAAASAWPCCPWSARECCCNWLRGMVGVPGGRGVPAADTRARTHTEKEGGRLKVKGTGTAGRKAHKKVRSLFIYKHSKTTKSDILRCHYLCCCSSSPDLLKRRDRGGSKNWWPGAFIYLVRTLSPARDVEIWV